ncbi:unnamed protein product [Lactuca virosa]|uniref:Uncharacterized protein n=1 Tax=Lactuca virosa TaxID=75947 RepID=A0AAU9MD64_9ASTR|nr:unnamed protein product [Lactuca virosa]
MCSIENKTPWSPCSRSMVYRSICSFHRFEVELGREESFAGDGGGVLLLDSVALAELLHIVAKLSGGVYPDNVRGSWAAGGHFLSQHVPIWVLGFWCLD